VSLAGLIPDGIGPHLGRDAKRNRPRRLTDESRKRIKEQIVGEKLTGLTFSSHSEG